VLNLSTLEELNVELAAKTFRAGWNKHEPSLWREPRTSFVPCGWRWRDAKPALDRAGDLISAELAERRNLFLVNPHEGNHYATVRTLVCAYQMILPGERARSHRHSPNALRLVLDAPAGIYTVVNGVRVDMQAGDVLLTPGNCWHGHANEGDRPAYWIDFLDVPLVHQLEPMFFENWPEGFQVPSKTERPRSLVFDQNASEAALRRAQLDGDGRIRHLLPTQSMKTMELGFELLRARTRTARLRTTQSQVLAVLDGKGTTEIAGQVIGWERGDVIAIPAWHPYRHEAEAEAILFGVSDKPVMEGLGFYKQEPADR
jgi:gentisate 1,2-dioxygenase